MDEVYAGGSVLGGDVRTRLEREALPAYLPSRRWYAGKARTLESVRVADAAPLAGFPPRTFLVLAEASYREGPSETYFLPLREVPADSAASLAGGADSHTVMRTDGGTTLIDALADPDVGRAILHAIEREGDLPAGRGTIRAIRTADFDVAGGDDPGALQARLGSVEQSNSVILYGTRLILKVFRRLQPGINPDFEIGTFLASRTRFDRVPRTAGALELRNPGQEPSTLAILQGWVENQGTGWDHALEEVRAYLEASPPGEAEPGGPSSAPPLPSYVRAAEQLGRRTAELHRALASCPDDPAFAPEPLAQADLAEVHADVREQLEATRDLMGKNLKTMPEHVQTLGRRFLDEAPSLLGRLADLTVTERFGSKIRVHGDYHLGQVLRTGDDFIILDFEGEPSKPLDRRRARHSPIKDVVGMLRSFDYAANAALFRLAEHEPRRFDLGLPLMRSWRDAVQHAFLNAYRATASSASFLPDETAFAELLRLFTLDKALYELLYELNNRPDWVGIPLQGILAQL